MPDALTTQTVFTKTTSYLTTTHRKPPAGGFLLYTQGTMKLKTLLSRFSNIWAGTLPPVAIPKVPNKQQTVPGFAKQITPSTSVLTKTDRSVANTSVLSARSEANTAAVIRKLAATSPDIGAAVFTYIRTAVTQGYKVKAFDSDGSFDEESTALAYEILARFDTLPDYVAEGFTNTPSIQTVSEALAKELVLEGSASFELVLDKSRLPSRLAPIPTSLIKFYQDGAGLRPIMRVGGVDIDLDYPTFFYTSLDQDLLSAYSSSPLEAAVQPVLADAEFTEDLRRSLKRAFLPRLTATIDLAKTKEMFTPDVLNDAKKLEEALLSVLSNVENTVNGLSPEDALVSFDSVTYKFMEGGNGEASSTVKTVQDIVNAKLSTGAKALPSVLGHGSGSQNVASSETLNFMKAADGAIRVKLNELYSRALTLSCRLLGKDVVVKFEYDPIDLRPVTELEAFKAQKQSRILELVSLGIMSTAEASIELTGRLPRKGYQELAGTFFTVNKPVDQNSTSNTSTLGQAITSKAPTNTRGGNGN